MFNRAGRLWVWRSVLAVLLFAEFAHASQACLLPEAIPAEAFEEAEKQPHYQGQLASSALCLDHCLGSDRVLDSLSQPAILRFLPPPLKTFAIEKTDRSAFVYIQSAALSHALSPPVYIQFRVFRD